MDGLTTNGVLVMHPRGGFTEESQPGVWREISVCGDVYTLRETRSAQQRGKLVSVLHSARRSRLHKPNSKAVVFPSPDVWNLCAGPSAVYHNSAEAEFHKPQKARGKWPYLLQWFNFLGVNCVLLLTT